MINEWKDYYNNDYIIFSINNEIVNDQYFSTKHILNTYQSRVDFIIDNIEDFSFKNEDDINSVENDFHINYAQQVLEVEENENKKKEANEGTNENIKEENKQNEILNSNDLKIQNENSHSSEGKSIENNENNIMSYEFLREEDFAIDNQSEENRVKAKEIKIITDPKNKFENKNSEEIENTTREHNNPIIARIGTDKDERIISTKDVSNLPLQKHDNNKKIEFKNFNNMDFCSLNEQIDIKNTSSEKASQKELKIQIEKDDDTHKEDSKERPKTYEIDKDNYKKLISNLKSQEQTDENNKYYSRKDKIENYDMDNKKINMNIFLNNIASSDKILDSKGNNLYPKENENENLQISNSLNSNNSHDFNNTNSENNEIADYDKYPKRDSRAQSYTTKSRDDEIKSLNDKLYSYKNQNKIILDENKKLLEIINIFKILQNLENSNKNSNSNSNNLDSVNENLDSDGINREIENINNNNDLLLKKDSNPTHIIKSEGNILKEEDKFIYKENQAFDNYGLLEFERFTKNEKKSIRNIDFSYAKKFLNSNNFVIEDNEINKTIRDEKIYKSENASINNRYDNINESSNLNLKNNLMLSDQKNEYENQYPEQRILNNSNQNLNQKIDNHYIVNNDVIRNESEIIVKNNFTYNKNILTSNEKICISVSSSNNLISPTSYDSTNNVSSNNNKKKTFIKIDDTLQNKGGYYSKNCKIMGNSTKANNNNNNDKLCNNEKRFNNKVSYINTNSIPTMNSKGNSGSNKSKTLATQSSIVFSNNQESPEYKKVNYPTNPNIKANGKIQINGEFNIYEHKNNIPFSQQAFFNYSSSQNPYDNGYKKNCNYVNNNRNFQKIPPNINLDNINKKAKDMKNYNHLIQYLEKYKELNDRLIETLENEKNDVKIDVNKRKRDVEYLEHILNYISGLGDNKESKDFIPFYLIDKRKLFENMVKYLYSKDEMTHSTKHRNVRLFKNQNKLK